MDLWSPGKTELIIPAHRALPTGKRAVRQQCRML
jgi:hypothetical protein